MMDFLLALDITRHTKKNTEREKQTNNLFIKLNFCVKFITYALCALDGMQSENALCKIKHKSEITFHVKQMFCDVRVCSIHQSFG